MFGLMIIRKKKYNELCEACSGSRAVMIDLLGRIRKMNKQLDDALSEEAVPQMSIEYEEREANVARGDGV